VVHDAIPVPLLRTADVRLALSLSAALSPLPLCTVAPHGEEREPRVRRAWLERGCSEQLVRDDVSALALEGEQECSRAWD
jgi:hypothetical protein